MNIALILFTLGILMIVAGYTNQISPHCNEGIQVKVVPRDIYDEIAKNQDMVDIVYNDMS